MGRATNDDADAALGARLLRADAARVAPLGDTIPGTPGPDTLTGTKGDDTITGLGGNDTINATKGADTIDGGAGFDKLVIDMGDTSRFDAVSGNVQYLFTNTHASSSAGGLDSALTSVERLTFTDVHGGNNTVDATGFTGFAQITLGAGNDTVRLGNSATAYLGLGANTVRGNGSFGESAVIDVDSSRAFAGGTVNNGITFTSYAGVTGNVVSNLQGVQNIGIRSGVPGVGLHFDASNMTQGYITLFDSDYDDVLLGSKTANTFASTYDTVAMAQLSDGLDLKIGNGGADDFDYSVAAPRDEGDFILDLDGDDVLDFSYYGLMTDGGDLTFLGTGAFTGHAREFRYDAVDGKTILTFDYDGDRTSDASVTILNGAFQLVDTQLLGGVNQLQIATAIDNVTGTDAGETLSGTSGADMIRGYAGDDVINAGAGDDTLMGGSGADRMNGGLGNDTFIVDNAGDRVVEQIDAGTDQVFASISYHLTANVENLTLGGQGPIDGTGNDLANMILGDRNVNVLSGLAGDDRLYGYDGDDTLDGGSGADVMDGGRGGDSYVVDDAGDRVIEEADNGIDSITASVDYTLSDNVENLTLTGGARHGVGNALDNAITGAGGADRLEGMDGDDTLTGAGGGDTLDGGAGRDMLDGGVGRDVLIGGTGRDTLTGGAGADMFVFRDGDSGNDTGSADLIADFTRADKDKIDLSAIDAHASTTDVNEAFTFIARAAFSGHEGELRITNIDGHLFAQGDTDGDGVANFMIEVHGPNQLIGADFVL